MAKPSILSQLAKYFPITRNKCSLTSIFAFVIFTDTSSSGLFLQRMLEPQHFYSKSFPPLCISTSGFCYLLYFSSSPLSVFDFFFFGSTLSSNLLCTLVFLILCSYYTPVGPPLNRNIRVFFLSC